LFRAGALPEIPEALAEDARIKVEYVSQLSVAQRSGRAAGVMRIMESVIPLAQVNPEILDNFDFDEIGRAIAEGYGAPPKILRDPRLIAQQREQRAQQQQAMQQAQMMAGAAQPMAHMARGVKDLVGAEREAMEATA
jgi:hypothetical protein